ncbi:hypothetical protein ACJX0J_026268, partial [Zea mays]
SRNNRIDPPNTVAIVNADVDLNHSWMDTTGKVVRRKEEAVGEEGDMERPTLLSEVLRMTQPAAFVSMQSSDGQPTPSNVSKNKMKDGGDVLFLDGFREVAVTIGRNSLFPQPLHPLLAMEHGSSIVIVVVESNRRDDDGLSEALMLGVGC